MKVGVSFVVMEYRNDTECEALLTTAKSNTDIADGPGIVSSWIMYALFVCIGILTTLIAKLSNLGRKHLVKTKVELMLYVYFGLL